MPHSTIQLPDRETMLKRLVKADDGQKLQEKFYPLLLTRADHITSIYGVTDILAKAIREYTSDKPVFIAAVMGLMAPLYLEALIKDPQTAKWAKEMLPQAIAAPAA
jgi:hypothetical protein